MTVVGRYGFDYDADADADGNGDWGGQIAYPAPMPETLAPEFVDAPGAPTADCPGSVQEPAASPGFLCVYEASLIGSNATMNFLGGSRFGVNYYIPDDGVAGDFFGYGTWAATAPDAPTATDRAPEIPTSKD